VTAPVASRQPPTRPPSLVARIVSLPFQILGVLVGSLMLAILVEWGGMLVVWPELGPRHAQAMLDYELDQLSVHFRRSLLVNEPAQTARRFVDDVIDWMADTGLPRRAAPAGGPDAHRDNPHDLRYYLSRVYIGSERYLTAAGYTALVVAVRALVLLLTLPLFVMAAFVGLIDGLVRRDVRRFAAGRESGFVYHRARASILPLLVLPWTLYLSLPVSVHPLTILLPCAALLGIAVGIAGSSFKKYL
jgi:integrating conjugative element membrane protein (TIGR03747 family)